MAGVLVLRKPTAAERPAARRSRTAAGWCFPLPAFDEEDISTTCVVLARVRSLPTAELQGSRKK